MTRGELLWLFYGCGFGLGVAGDQPVLCFLAFSAMAGTGLWRVIVADRQRRDSRDTFNRMRAAMAQPQRQPAQPAREEYRGKIIDI